MFNKLYEVVTTKNCKIPYLPELLPIQRYKISSVLSRMTGNMPPT